MGENIANFLNSFNAGLDAAIPKQDAKRVEFKSVRDKAIAITGVKIVNWPSDVSVKTIGDLLGYVFPASGGVINRPPATLYNAPSPIYVDFIKEMRREPDIEKAYGDLEKSYSGFEYSWSKLKEKGGAQFWFDYVMYYAIEFFLKDAVLIEKIKTDEYKAWEAEGGQLSGDGSKVGHYNLPAFKAIIWEDSSYNGYSGLDSLLTKNLTTDELLFNAFFEAGESYSGPYTNEIRTSGKSLLKVLDVREEPKPPSGGTSGTSGTSGNSGTSGTEGTSGTSGTSGTNGSFGTSGNATKFKPMLKGIEDGFQITAKTDLPSFSIYVGDPDKWPVPETIEEEIAAGNADDFTDLDDLDNEYTEDEFKGAEEMGITIEEYKHQSEIADGQEDGDTGLTEEGAVVDIKPVSSFDSLLQLAGKCARELGKNTRVNYENLRKSYIKGVHGLCPQGTQAVLYAMTGVKSLGKISGNADHFSFKNGGKAKFPSTHYNDKVKVGKDYWKNKSKWQVGDVIAVGYINNKPYGHIQVWTGTKWMSDFTQGALQSNNVDWETPALWRLNSKGVSVVKAQMGSIS